MSDPTLPSCPLHGRREINRHAPRGFQLDAKGAGVPATCKVPVDLPPVDEIVDRKDESFVREAVPARSQRCGELLVAPGEK